MKNHTHNLLTRSLWILVALVSLGQLQRIELSPTIAFYAHDVFIVCWLIGIYCLYKNTLAKQLNTFSTNRWFKLAVGALLWSLLVTLWTSWQQQTIVPLLYLGRLLAYVGFASSLKLIQPGLIQQTQHFSIAVIVALLGLAQFFLLPDTRFLFILGWDDHYYRLISTLFDPAFTGALLLLGLLFSFAIPNKVPRRWIFFARIVLIGAIVLTFSRTTYLATLVAIIPLVAHKQKDLWKNLLIAGTAVVLLSSALQFSIGGEGTKLWRLSTVNARAHNIESSIKNLSPRDLVLGKGWFTYQVNQNTTFPNHAKVPDNLLVMMISSMGIPAFVAFLTAVGVLLKKTIYNRPILQAVVLAVLVHTQFNNTLLQPFIWLYLWWGVVVNTTTASE